jgi:hypothetical protein
MLSNLSEFQVVLERYEDDPGLCSKLLRTHSLTDPHTFIQYAETEILERPVSRALKFITGLAIAAGLIERLLVLHGQSRTDAFTLAKKLLLCDPRFDITLMEYLLHPRSGKVPEETAFNTILDILDVISDGDRLVPSVLKVLKHSNPKIRSKAALFIGSRTQNLAWAANRTQEYDARVRANILESLIGLNSEFVHQLFRSNVDDENNRVAGNAVLGLYLLGDTASIPLIHEMARHPESRFRNTCAWVMGRTGDPRFAPAFSELINDPDQIVRAQAFKGLGEVRKALRASVNREQLKAAIVKARFEAGNSLCATVQDSAGQPVRGISPISFILKTGTPAKFVREFNVHEYDCRSSLTIAFVICLPADGEQSADAHFTEAVESCNELRRSKDRWAIAKISGASSAAGRFGPPASDAANRYRQKWSILNVDYPAPGGTASAGTPALAAHENRFEYSPLQHRIDAMLHDSPMSISGGPEDEATRIMLDALLRVDLSWGKPHLIFLGGGPQPVLMEALRAKGADLPAVVHVLAESAAWHDPELQRFVESTGGVYKRASSSEFIHSCVDLHASLIHHYAVHWKEGAGPLELDIFAEAGKASAVYDMDASVELVHDLVGA